MKNIIYNSALELREYLGSSVDSSRLSVRINLIVYIIIYELFTVNQFLTAFIILEIVNFIAWKKFIKSGKLERKAEKIDEKSVL